MAGPRQGSRLHVMSICAPLRLLLNEKKTLPPPPTECAGGATMDRRWRSWSLMRALQPDH